MRRVTRFIFHIKTDSYLDQLLCFDCVTDREIDEQNKTEQRIELFLCVLAGAFRNVFLVGLVLP